MSIRHKKRPSHKVSSHAHRKNLANEARRKGHLRSGQSAAQFTTDQLEKMAA